MPRGNTALREGLMTDTHIRKIAQERDNKVIEARQAEAEAAAALAAPAEDFSADDVFDAGLVETPESRDE